LWNLVEQFILQIAISHQQLDNAKLREMFSLAGKVITAEVTKDKDGSVARNLCCTCLVRPPNDLQHGVTV
jgi:hypothetical protein